MNTSIIARDGYIPVKKGDMVIIIPEDEKEQRIAHLDSLIPADQAQYDEITELLTIVNHEEKCKLTKPTLKLVKG